MVSVPTHSSEKQTLLGAPETEIVAPPAGFEASTIR